MSHFVLKYVLGLVFILAVTHAPANETAKHKLASVEDFHKKYGCQCTTSDALGNQYFWGSRIGLRDVYTIKNRLYRFAPKSLEVLQVVPDELLDRYLTKDRNVGGISIDAKGLKLAMSITSATLSPHSLRIHSEILMIDIRKSAGAILLSGDQIYDGVSLSPDGRHIAFYSNTTASRTVFDEIASQNVGKILEVKTRKVVKYTDPFSVHGFLPCASPQWLDNDHVLFKTMSTDADFINKYVKPDEYREIFSGLPYCPYVAVVCPSNGTVKRLFMPGGHLLPESVMDSTKKKLYFYESSNEKRQVVIEADFNLENQRTVLDINPEKNHSIMAFMDDGELKYKYNGLTHKINR